MNRLLLILSSSLISMPALAHPGHALASAQAGFLHPLSGVDHLLVMLAIGIWAGRIGGQARWQLPLTFVLVMATGAGLGMSGWFLPGVEFGLAVSVLAMGLLIALHAPLGRLWQFSLVAFFALLHGLAHGAELSHQGAAAVMTGMLVATILLHAVGLFLSQGRMALTSALQRVLGSAIALCGAYLLIA